MATDLLRLDAGRAIREALADQRRLDLVRLSVWPYRSKLTDAGRYDPLARPFIR